MDRTNVVWFLGLSGALAVFGVALGVLIVPSNIAARSFVVVQWLLFSLVLGYLIVLRGSE